MMKRIVLVLLFSLTASAYAGGWEKPDAATLNELFSDTTVYGSQFVVYYAPDGTQKGKWGGKQYNGDWKINEEGRRDRRQIAACETQPVPSRERGKPT